MTQEEYADALCDARCHLREVNRAIDQMLLQASPSQRLALATAMRGTNTQLGNLQLLERRLAMISQEVAA